MDGETYLAWIAYLVNNTVLNTVQATKLVEGMRDANKITQDDFDMLERQIMLGGYELALKYINSLGHDREG